MSAATGGLMQRRMILLGIAMVLTLLNALKAPRIDDTFYLFFAQQIALNPIDPAGFDLHWFEWPMHASDQLAPPLLIYWLGGAISLFGENPFLWKLSLLPFALILIFAVHALARRFAPGAELPLTCFIVFSPAFLPGFNFMLDVPAEALIFAALAVFTVTGDKRGIGWSILAGLLAGLAMLTKYTGIVAPAAIMLYALFFGRIRLAILACGLSAAIFISWEFVTYLMYGRSQFLFTLLNTFTAPWDKLNLAESLVTTLGGVHVAIVLLALAVWSAPRGLLGMIAATVLAGYGMIALQSLENIVFAVYGTVTIATIVAVSFRLLQPAASGNWWHNLWLERRPACFLVSLLLLELAAFFVISPFGAVRRVMGFTVVSTLLVGCLATLKMSAAGNSRVLWAVAAFNLLLGLGFHALDMRAAQAFRQGVERSIAAIGDRREPGGTIWYLGRWGFQFHAERAGMQPLVPEYSQVRAGDWIVLPDTAYASAITAGAGDTQLIETITIDDAVRLTTHPVYYSGYVPLAHRKQPRLQVRLYRAMADFTPHTGRDPETVAYWLKQNRNTSAAVMALPALIRNLKDRNPKYRYFSAEALAMLGPRAGQARPALQAALNDPDSRVSAAAARALERITAE